MSLGFRPEQKESWKLPLVEMKIGAENPVDMLCLIIKFNGKSMRLVRTEVKDSTVYRCVYTPGSGGCGPGLRGKPEAASKSLQ